MTGLNSNTGPVKPRRRNLGLFSKLADNLYLPAIFLALAAMPAQRADICRG